MTPPADPRRRIVDIALDERNVVRWSPEIEHERRVAVFDLLEDNSFELADGFAGPYAVRLSISENRLEMDVRAADGSEGKARVTLALAGLRRIVKDYFTVCESYFEAIRTAPPSRIEALDMGRRSVHDEGAEILRSRLEDRVRIDDGTARRLFTLLCVLRLRG